MVSQKAAQNAFCLLCLFSYTTSQRPLGLRAECCPCLIQKGLVALTPVGLGQHTTPGEQVKRHLSPGPGTKAQVTP